VKCREYVQKRSSVPMRLAFVTLPLRGGLNDDHVVSINGQTLESEPPLTNTALATRAVQRQYLPTRPSIMYLRIYTPPYLCIIMYIGGVSIGRILVYFRQLSSPSRTRGIGR
jgi:hypothetical protein